MNREGWGGLTMSEGWHGVLPVVIEGFNGIDGNPGFDWQGI